MAQSSPPGSRIPTAQRSVHALPGLLRSAFSILRRKGRLLLTLLLFCLSAVSSFRGLCPSPLTSPFHDQQLIAFKEQVLMRVVPTLSEVWKEGSQEVRRWEGAVSPLHPTHHHHHHTPLNTVDRRCTLQQQCRFAPGTICDVSASCPPKKPRNAMRC